MNSKKIFLTISVVLVLVSCGRQQKQVETPLEEYPILKVEKQDVTLQSSYPSTIKGQEDIEIRPRIDGFIKEVYVDEGSVVKKGQTLFKIDSPVSEQNVRTSQAALESAKAKLNTAKVNADRIRPLAEKEIISQVQLDIAENDYETALAAYRQAEATLTNAEATLSWTNVSSPVNGVVGSIPFRLGSLVNSSNALTTISNTGNVYVYFSINEKELMNLLDRLEGKTQSEKIKDIPEVTLILANGNEYSEKGKIETIEGRVDNTTGAATLRATFPNSHGILKSGTSGKIIIPEYKTDVLVIPQKATFARQNKIITYKVEGDIVTETLISVLPTPDGQSYVVTEGLNPGDTIVTDGLITLHQGKKIKVN
ncbi:MAG: efflux RND transporter periplasmic adaptor subunit [Bacteroidales bacterium]|nr:efflux RND transporter periplasmic adaptor subunit [Bacteroidales bacterium]